MKSKQKSAPCQTPATCVFNYLRQIAHQTKGGAAVVLVTLASSQDRAAEIEVTVPTAALNSPARLRAAILKAAGCWLDTSRYEGPHWRRENWSAAVAAAFESGSAR